MYVVYFDAYSIHSRVEVDLLAVCALIEGLDHDLLLLRFGIIEQCPHHPALLHSRRIQWLHYHGGS